MTGHTDYTTRQAAYDLRKLRGKDLIIKPGRSRRYHLPAQPARTITALLTLREQVISPILAGPPQPTTGTQTHPLDRHRPRLRNPPHQHANPLPRPRHHHQRRRGIDNFLSIEVPQAPVPQAPRLDSESRNVAGWVTLKFFIPAADDVIGESGAGP